MDYWPAGVPYGGGIANESGTAIISNSTLSKNTALIHTPFGSAGTYGGGIYNDGSANATFQNSVLANNTSGGNCTGTLNSLGYNMSSDNTCHLNGPGDQKSINPMLGGIAKQRRPYKHHGSTYGKSCDECRQPERLHRWQRSPADNRSAGCDSSHPLRHGSVRTLASRLR